MCKVNNSYLWTNDLYGPINSVADLACLSRIPDHTFSYPGSELFPSRIPDPHQRIQVYDPGCSSRPDPNFLPIPNPGVKKEPDPGSGSATLPIKPLQVQVGVSRTLEIETCLGPAKRHVAVRRVPFGAQKS